MPPVSIPGKNVMKTVKPSFFILFFCATLVCGCVAPDEMSALKNRVAALENLLAAQDGKLLEEENKSIRLDARLDALSEKTQAVDENYRYQTAETQATIDQLRVDVQALRGRVEETEYTIRRQASGSQETPGLEAGRLDRIESLSKKNEDRLYRIEQYLHLESAEKPPSREPVASKTPKELSEEELYQSAKQAFDGQNYETAREQFETFLKKYSKSQLANNAQFWIGETYYREKWYEKAILEYQKVIENYPTGNKVPAALLKQGFAFLNLGDKSNSRLILRELMKKYPNSGEATVAEQKLKDIH